MSHLMTLVKWKLGKQNKNRNLLTKDFSFLALGIVGNTHLRGHQVGHCKY